jgi:hypothetical protein
MTLRWAILFSVWISSASGKPTNQTKALGHADTKEVSTRLCDRVGVPAKLELVPLPNHGDVCRFSDGSGDFGCAKYCRKMEAAPWCATAHVKEITPCRPLEADAKARASKETPAVRMAHGAAAAAQAKGAKVAPVSNTAKPKNSGVRR